MYVDFYRFRIQSDIIEMLAQVGPKLSDPDVSYPLEKFSKCRKSILRAAALHTATLIKYSVIWKIFKRIIGQKPMAGRGILMSDLSSYLITMLMSDPSRLIYRCEFDKPVCLIRYFTYLFVLISETYLRKRFPLVLRF